MKATTPSIPITDPRFKYVPARQTDILATFKRLGWTPPSQQRKGKAK